MTTASAAHLPRQQRAALLKKKAIIDGVSVAGFAAITFIFPGQIYTIAAAVLSAYFVLRLGQTLYTLTVESSGAALAAAEDDFNRRNPDQPMGPGSAVEQAAGRIAAGTLASFRANNIHPVSLVIALFNLAGAKSNTLTAFVSRLNDDGTLITSRYPAAATEQLFASFPTPFDAGRDWRAAIISARDGEPATCRLWDEAQADAFVTAAKTLDDPEAFRPYHP